MTKTNGLPFPYSERTRLTETIKTPQLALGTAQFGLNYGVSNQQGQVALEEIRRILDLAHDSGLDTLDTAIAYGNSEQALGQAGMRGWRIVTKLPGLPKDQTDARRWVEEQLHGSCERLGTESLHAVLLHRPADLLGAHGDAIWAGLIQAHHQGLVNRIGVSVYDPNELAALLPRFELQIVQAPFNILDRRLLTEGWMEQLTERGIELHARSIFLQGLLLMPPEHRPAWFSRWDDLWEHWHAWLEDTKQSALQACLGFALETTSISRILIGVQSAEQLRELLAAAAVLKQPPPPDLVCHDLDLIHPSCWTLTT